MLISSNKGNLSHEDAKGHPKVDSQSHLANIYNVARKPGIVKIRIYDWTEAYVRSLVLNLSK